MNLKSTRRLMPWVVLKFGGSSVATAEHWETIFDIVQQRLVSGERPFVVCSALGGTTDVLSCLYGAAVDGASFEAAYQTLTERYAEVGKGLGVGALDLLSEELSDLAGNLERVAEAGADPRRQAKIMASGERMTTLLGAAYLKHRGLSTTWLDAREHLKSELSPDAGGDRYYLSASCNYDQDTSLIGRLENAGGGVAITQGFVAGTPQNETVLLGRGGSDTSASYFASKLGAARLEIWTDVPGMFSANPRWVEDARLLYKLHYEDAASLAASGAKVLHPRCVQPARDAGIPIYIKCTRAPFLDGSVINGHSERGNDWSVKAVSSRSDLCMIHAENFDDGNAVMEALPEFTRVLRKRRLLSDSMVACEQGIRATIDTELTPFSTLEERSLVEELSPFSSPRIQRGLSSVSLCGSGLSEHFHLIGPACSTFDSNRIYYINPAGDGRCLTFILDGEEPREWVTKLHRNLIADKDSKQLGPTWQEIQDEMAAKPEESWSRTVAN